QSHPAIVLFSNYVYHARIIHSKGHPQYYRRMDRLGALDKCISYLQFCTGKKPEIVCRIIPKIKKELETILPVPSNHSYHKSLNRLTTLIGIFETFNHKNQPAYGH
ncbi:MAG: hypothetical protein WCL00_15070, partial [Bacteroidota bacterium]